MNRSSEELKQMARERLTSNYSICIGTYLLLVVILIIPTFVKSSILTGGVAANSNILSYFFRFLITIAFTALKSLLMAGLTYFYLNVIRSKNFTFTDLFYPFKHHPDTFIVAGIITFLITLVVSVPFDLLYNHVENLNVLITLLFLLLETLLSWLILVGFSFTVPAMLDNPDISPIEAIKKSFALLKGHKLRLLYISLSFIRLALLSILTLGIGLLWLLPYMNCTILLLYLECTGELDAPQTIHNNSNDSIDHHINHMNA